MLNRLLIIHRGGPTCVLNASTYGVIREAKKHTKKISGVFGCMGGVGGLLSRNFRRLDSLAQKRLERLKSTPGTVIDSSLLHPLAADDYARLADVLQEEGFSYVLMSGGNGTMDTCRRLHRVCAPQGILVGGVPKTVDNDISVTDHSPGLGSAARYIAGAVRAIGEDVKSLPIHVCIVEAMGRNAGWIAAATALARKDSGDAPYLIYLPERPFGEEAFLRDVKALHERQGGVVVVVSEGLKNRDGQPIVPPLFQTGRAVYYVHWAEKKYDVVVFGMPTNFHYGDGMGTNPIQMMQALSAQVIRHKRILSDRCVFIVSSVCDGYFHDERWPYLRELYELFQHDYMNVLPDMNRYGEYFATNGEYIRKYRFANAFHPFHGFSMMSCGHLAEMHTSAIYIVGAREPGLARGMGLKTRATFEEALEDARKKFVGEAPSILALPQTFTTAAVHLCMRDPMQNSRSRDSVLHPCGA